LVARSGHPEYKLPSGRTHYRIDYASNHQS
jgi:hypothetical protein